MKKFLITTNIFTAGLLAWLFFNGNIVTNNKPSTKSNTCDNFCADYTGKGVTKYDVSVLDTISKLYKNTAGSKAASNIWFSLDTLKRFIWNIEHNVCGITCGVEKYNPQLGIRIYFAKYPDRGFMSTKSDLRNVDPNFEKLQTLFMIPTYDSLITSVSPNITKHIDFDPTNKGTFNKKRCAFQKIDLSSGLVMAFTFPTGTSPITSGSPNTSGQNHGSLCPPVCDGGEAF